MNEENVMRMRQPKRGVQTRNDHEYAMKKTFMSGALAGPGLIPFTAALRRPHHGAYRNGPGAFDGAAEINPNA
jgi:hypothetical protein